MIILGLTGSIGMGKSTVTAQFAEAGAATTNADTIVHGLLAEDKEVIARVGKAFPQAVENGIINRRILGNRVFGDDAAMQVLESILHPKVRAAEMAFILKAQQAGREVAVLDIPLLYETGADTRCDVVVVVTAPQAVQRERVLSRPGMTEAKFHDILARQLPDEEKRARADFVIETHKGLEHSAAKVREILHSLKHKDTPHA